MLIENVLFIEKERERDGEIRAYNLHFSLSKGVFMKDVAKNRDFKSPPSEHA